MAEAILIVDDEQSILDGMRRTLSRLYSITTALSGSDALAQIAASSPFAVIMSDMRIDGARPVASFVALVDQCVRQRGLGEL